MIQQDSEILPGPRDAVILHKPNTLRDIPT
jgi:hypothetical protein